MPPKPLPNNIVSGPGGYALQPGGGAPATPAPIVPAPGSATANPNDNPNAFGPNQQPKPQPTPAGGVSTGATATPVPVQTGANVDPFTFGQVVQSMTDRMKENNKLFKNRNVLIQHMYSSVGADPKDISGLDPKVQELIKSGSRPEQEMYLRMVNDQISGRNQTLDTSLKFLADEYNTSLDRIDKQKQSAIDAVNEMIKNSPGGVAALKTMYPQYAEYIDALSTGGGGNVGGYNIGSYATDPNHETAVARIYGQVSGIAGNPEELGSYIQSIAPTSPITGEMIVASANKYGVDPGMVASLIQQDSSFGTKGKAVRTRNPGNVGNDDAGNERTFSSWESGVDAVAEWLSRNKATETGVDTKNLATAVAGIKFNSVADRKNAETVISDLLADGDIQGAKQQLRIYAYNSMSADEQQKVAGKEDALDALDRVNNLMADFVAQGGSTGIFTGLKQKTLEKGGFYSGPASDIANEIALAIVDYRKAVSGAAFTESERKEYDKIFPSTGKTPELNQSKINTLNTKFSADIDNTYARRIPKYKEIFGGSQTTGGTTTGKLTPDGFSADKAGIQLTKPEYQSLMSKVPPGKVLVYDKASKQYGYMSPNDPDRAKYIKVPTGLFN